jgi:hypothetical protein
MIEANQSIGMLCDRIYLIRTTSRPAARRPTPEAHNRLDDRRSRCVARLWLAFAQPRIVWFR